jgi:cytoskeletal protein CcmA (bactofilin family)
MTHIGASVTFDGDFTCEEDLTVEGRLTGNIHVREATLVVAQAASLEASVRAARVVVHGKVQGSISAGQRIELSQTSVVIGDLRANQIVVTDVPDSTAESTWDADRSPRRQRWTILPSRWE